MWKYILVVLQQYLRIYATGYNFHNIFVFCTQYNNIDRLHLLFFLRRQNQLNSTPQSIQRSSTTQFNSAKRSAAPPARTHLSTLNCRFVELTWLSRQMDWVVEFNWSLRYIYLVNAYLRQYDGTTVRAYMIYIKYIKIPTIQKYKI